ncbi:MULTISPECIES: histidine phosphatase family protein [Bacillus cereus group]|uniref:Histidine phosphatase family protein n=1 Tax=Bacillus cereus TaxID=1396 RepID=A0AA44QE69_BACCE|nr:MULTISPECIES: histidine phosphatase family protein [Bacillus cereus group]EEL50770.1 Phosphoglycerate mutase [Bacillus cereus Rock3-44]PFA22916.1 histidine phosphatase family protein [Bacillus cereus]PFN06970.1 histidine phosphatase family protein [Bacillus cereus]PFO80532.1 histidine phosphatase family protein [Bacillus cereus]PFR24297.1 histidine phosphatase family protein [Bacillus cereus]
MTTLGIIRHGSTHWNKEGRAQGNSNIPLDPDGFSDAYKLAERLATENWDIIYSSDLLRAKQTAEAIGKNIDNIEIYLDPRLREAGGGEIEGTTEEERISKWGENWRNLNLGIESADSVLARALPLIEEITYKHPNKNVLIVSHGAFIKYLLKELVPQLNMTDSLKNTSITKIRKLENGWDSELYNCTIHLN